MEAKDIAVTEQSNEMKQFNEQSQIPAQQISPMQQMLQAKEMGLTIDEMKEMMVLQKEYEANEAKKAFNLALADFKSETIEIVKDRTVSYNDTTYSHASLGNIVKIATPYMSKHGMTHRWITEQGDGGIKVTCVLSHRLGHSESTTLFSIPDASGGKNAIQAVASTITYLERYTFLAITGLAVEEQDDDGNSSGQPTQQPEVQKTPEYPQESFDKNLPKWTNLISSGKKKAQGIISTVQSQYVMTSEQRKQLLAIKVEK